MLARTEGDFLDDLPHDVPIYTLNTPRLLIALVPLAVFLHRTRWDVVFSTSGGMNLVAAAAHRLSGSRSRLVLSERGLQRHEISLKRWLLLPLKRRLYKQADHITTVSEGVKAELVEILGLNARNIAVVYNPIVTSELQVLAKEPVEHLWFFQPIPIILAAGRLVPEKDFATLIRAFAQVRSIREARLMILGEGPLRSELSELARSLGIERDVALPGFDKNPFKYMARCALFVLSSRFEGLPGVLIQAMACGSPVISTACPSGPSEIIDDEVDGLLVPVGNVHRLADRIGYLLDNPNVRERLSLNGRRAVQRFHADAVVTAYSRALMGSADGSEVGP